MVNTGLLRGHAHWHEASEVATGSRCTTKGPSEKVHVWAVRGWAPLTKGCTRKPCAEESMCLWTVLTDEMASVREVDWRTRLVHFWMPLSVAPSCETSL